MPKQTIDVLMGGYLSKAAARDDFEAVQACGAPLLGLVVVSKGLDGSMEIEQHDHIVKEGAVALGGAGFVVGLLAPPLLVATAVGAVMAPASARSPTARSRARWRPRLRRPSRSAVPA